MTQSHLYAEAKCFVEEAVKNSNDILNLLGRSVTLLVILFFFKAPTQLFLLGMGRGWTGSG